MKYTVNELHSLLRKKEVTSVEITEHYLSEIEKDKLNLFVTVTPEIALERAKKADIMISEGKAGVMTGIPIGVKDIFCTKGVLTTSCSKMLHNFVPNYESHVTQKLIDAGAVMLGKLNMDEFAMGSANINSYFGPAKNPWGAVEGTVPGGSSGGSAAAVTAGLCAASLGSDTGGSVRQPASFCGTVGVKPTYGRCSRWGMIAFASSLDQAGVFANNVSDAALVLESICGYDKRDSTSKKDIADFCANDVRDDIKGKRIGIPKEYNIDGVPVEVSKMWAQGVKWLESAGAEIVEISLPYTQYALPAYYIIAPAEASSNLARYDGVRYGLRVPGKNIEEMYELTREAGFGREVKKRILIGTYVLSSKYYNAYYMKAQYIRRLIVKEFESAFEKVDAILTPTTPTEAFSINDQPNSLMMYINDIFTVPANLAGLPAISVPAALSANGLPLGLQVIANSFDESTLFSVAKSLEASANFNAGHGV